MWMGYERKRGKLAALNALLRGRDPESRLLAGGRQHGVACNRSST